MVSQNFLLYYWNVQDVRASLQATKKHVKQRNKNTNHQHWFDKDCKSIMKKINSLGKQLRQNPLNVAVRENLFVTKRNFKNMIKKKTTLHKKSIVDKMHLTKQSEIKQFWELLNKLDLDRTPFNNAAKM